ncbi:MAG: hypothetical protein U0821_12210 [Chloroflexota bacterium]
MDLLIRFLRRRAGNVALMLAILSLVPRGAAVSAQGTEQDDLRSEPQVVCPKTRESGPTAWRLEGNERVNAMRGSIAETLSAVEVRWRGLSGELQGFRAGADYEFIYARDTSTINPMAQYYYSLPVLARPVEEFLQLQYDAESGDPEDRVWVRPTQAGAVSGILGPTPVAEKTLVTSDEETSLIHMAYVAYRAGAGPGWLREQQAGKPRIQRLNDAMGWLYTQRMVPGLGLIKRGHTTDWGDVEVGQGLASGPAMPEPREWTASIFDQAWTYRALMELYEMNRAAQQDQMAEIQLARARALRQASAERLWQPEKGFFRTHVHLPPKTHEFDEDGMVSIANAVAVYSGLAGPTERGPIFRVLEQARQAAGARKAGLSLYPTYPQGFFDYPQMQPGRYQNGAVWDWWGGIQISAEFWNGHSALARQHLDLAAADWARQGGSVLEWQDVHTGQNGGSAAYAGAASTMGEGIVSGLFGVELWLEGFNISSRLGAQNAAIHVNHPPSGCWLDYWQTYGEEAIVLEWDTNHTAPGRIRVLLADRSRAERTLVDGKVVPTTLESLGEDSYLLVGEPVPPGKHRLEIRLKPKGLL